MANMKKKRSNNLTDQLRAAVAGSGRSLGDLARATGIDKSALSRFINGQRGVSMQALDALGRCLGLQIVANETQTKEGDN